MKATPEDEASFNELAAAIEQAAAEEREIMEEAEADVRSEDVAAARRVVSEDLDRSLNTNGLAPDGPPPPGAPLPAGDAPRGISRWIPLAAAAAILCAALGWKLGSDTTPHSVDPAKRTWLGRQAIRLVGPIDGVKAFDKLRWEGALAPGERWTVTIESRAGGNAWGQRVVRETASSELDVSALLGDSPAGTEIRWRVACLAMGVTSGWQEAISTGEN